MDLWSLYFKEREGYETVTTGRGILSYKIDNDVCYIRDVFVHPDCRHTGEASLLADAVSEIARERGCKSLTGSIVPSMNGATGSMIGLLKYGFKLNWAKEDFICLIKEL